MVQGSIALDFMNHLQFLKSRNVKCQTIRYCKLDPITEYKYLFFFYTSYYRSINSYNFISLENGRFWLIPSVIKWSSKVKVLKCGVMGGGKRRGIMQTSQWLILAWDVSPLMVAGRGAYWLIAAGGVRFCTFTFWWIGCQGHEQPNMAP